MTQLLQKTLTPFLVAGLLLAGGLALIPIQTQAAHEEPATTLTKAEKLQLLTQLVEAIKEAKANGSEPQSVTEVTSPAADLRVALNKAMQGHVGLGLAALRNVNDESDDLTASVEALDKNSVAIAGLVESVYGDDAGDAFLVIWRNHIGDFASYATGARENDEDMKDDALDNLKDYQQEIAAFFSGAIPSIDKATVIKGSGEHRDLFIDAIDAYADEDFEEAYDLQIQAAAQIQGIADLLSVGIVTQYPEKF